LFKKEQLDFSQTKLVKIFTFNKINSSKTVEKNNDLAKTKSENEANYLVLLWSKLDFFLI
jgi:hypothetical protein